jgi:tetratricopeptide (TPR) repeat protein
MKTVFRLATACLLVCLTSPRSVQAGGYSAESPYEIAEMLFAKKNYRTALTYYQKALNQGEVRAEYGIGLIYEQGGKDPDALEHYRRFIDLAQPEDAKRKDAVQRIGAIETRREKKTARATELLKRGEHLFKKGRYREAEQVLLRAVAAEKSNPETHFYLGEVYMKLEKYDKAKTEYKKATRSY